MSSKHFPSGKRLRNELENHHAVNGKTHYFNDHFQVRKLLVITLIHH